MDTFVSAKNAKCCAVDYYCIVIEEPQNCDLSKMLLLREINLLDFVVQVKLQE